MPIDLPDDSQLWTTPIPVPGTVIQGIETTVTCLPTSGAVLISGDLTAAVDALAPGAPMLGLLDQEPDGPFALRIARDSALLVTADPLEATPGWHDGWALSLADDLHVCLAIEGPGSEDVRSACMSARQGSPSAAAIFGDKTCLVTRAGDALHVRVPAPEAATLWLWLARLIALPVS